jgi:hypothetical protein
MGYIIVNLVWPLLAGESFNPEDAEVTEDAENY